MPPAGLRSIHYHDAGRQRRGSVKRAVFVAAAVMLLLGCAAAVRGDDELVRHLDAVKTDTGNLYGKNDNLIPAFLALASAAAFAKGSGDRDFQEYYQRRLRSDKTDDVASVFRASGSVYAAAPVLAVTSLIAEGSPAAEWSARSIRALVVGAPAGLFLQRALGGAPPEEGDSEWKPFRNDAGLSGHAFVGAVPFITAARMSEHPVAKGLWYGLSILPALSRINDNKHYLSQAALGWELAHLSCSAVNRTTERANTAVSIAPVPGAGLGVILTRRF